MLKCGVEHTLARHHPPRTDLVGCAVGHDGDVMTVLDETEGELEAGLAAPNNEKG